ncbi:asparagine synthase (glutamine-hydrolyzing) [Xenorhabdus bovienii]|uniref:asparagine synthase (glutamine-hydrolyzing) n=1 Tax=Xenorhabdus bovienii TaxID=40576 RepID=UPI0023B217DB|nr:asparagine synthase (glutamine-hydrolyzing) [Xenorhabdus bovienii]MDE9493470.1 asparagine synthase (glutamine-hydrolyzing) [Xenorhabdus bovienii]MDE9502007.1 asparagine synthase (glutamine-hydrolyzing) [Xenorhabdus bovienii]MDE9519016.1 asparagine synthase (glutamine-hydrolyzing) [Xenorhabdus bovienii]MDE9524395.1 asparagine synthase (glutamine-hydrolyzing) [Xenorhabdus bovienii]MDE9570044.1 asparagine synthase (glutamine-hydrolyzing) [Xenorhabdus bovienii]
MCGITGWLSYNQHMEGHRNIIQKMTDTMSNRGPDAQGIWIDGPIALGHRRLSIIDLEGGRQPMAAKYKSNKEIVVITYSGEVYNFRELRIELEYRGHHFSTLSDTEVVLRAYIEWGIDFAEKLNGMYAFAIWDIHQQSLILVRDRMGVKPLYYYQTGDGVIFGSEPKAILANPIVSARVSEEGLREILEMVKTPGHAIFDGMREILPGEIIIFNRQGVNQRRYWKLEATEHTDSLGKTISHTRDLLEDIVEKQILSDVPICSLLSGGLDSSIITALASKKLLESQKENINSFSIDFADHGSQFVVDSVRGTPDAPFVHDLVSMIKSNHNEIILNSSELADNDLRMKVIRALDFPPAFWGDMWPSLYRLFEEVRKHSKVALSGESADEVFGGYRWFHDPESINANTYPWLTSVTGKYFDGKPLFSLNLLNKLKMNEFLKDNYAQALAETPLLSGESDIDKRMRQISYVNLTRFVQTLLDRKDRMSMAVGLEVRVPFCDHRLVEYAFNIPWNMKSFDGREKSILRAATRDILPASISERVKSPYPSTQDPAYENALRNTMSEIMLDNQAPVRPLLDQKLVSEKLSFSVGSNSPMYSRMGMELAVGLNSWLKEYKVELNF